MNHNHIHIFCRKFTETEERITVEGLTQHTLEIGAPLTRMSLFPYWPRSCEKSSVFGWTGPEEGTPVWRLIFRPILGYEKRIRALGAALQAPANGGFSFFGLQARIAWSNPGTPRIFTTRFML